jgi:uncharacterized RmlC-like cupin family protein
MPDPDRLRVLPPDGRRLPAGQATPGMHRLEALAEDGVWLGTVRTEPGTLTGWHHHGTYESYIYMTRGSARFDTYLDGEVVRQEAPEGSFVVVPPHAVHREGSVSADGVDAVLVRIGTGQVTFNVEGLPEGE